MVEEEVPVVSEKVQIKINTEVRLERTKEVGSKNIKKIKREVKRGAFQHTSRGFLRCGARSKTEHTSAETCDKEVLASRDHILQKPRRRL